MITVLMIHPGCGHCIALLVYVFEVHMTSRRICQVRVAEAVCSLSPLFVPREAEAVSVFSNLRQLLSNYLSRHEDCGLPLLRHLCNILFAFGAL